MYRAKHPQWFKVFTKKNYCDQIQQAEEPGLNGGVSIVWAKSTKLDAKNTPTLVFMRGSWGFINYKKDV